MRSTRSIGLHNRGRYLVSFLLLGGIPTVLLLFLLTAKQLLVVLGVICFVLLLGTPIDIALVNQHKIGSKWAWTFNKESILGIYLFGVPVEELIFVVFYAAGSIAAWEFVKSLSLTETQLLLAVVLIIVFVTVVYPMLGRPDKG